MEYLNNYLSVLPNYDRKEVEQTITRKYGFV